MAGEFLQVRTDLRDDPAVLGIASRLDLEAIRSRIEDHLEDLVVGKLIRVWAWANQQSTDGRFPALDARETVDRLTSIEGLASAMLAVGWLASHERLEGGGFAIPSFEKWNSISAKERALRRKRNERYRLKLRDARETPVRRSVRRGPSHTLISTSEEPSRVLSDVSGVRGGARPGAERSPSGRSAQPAAPPHDRPWGSGDPAPLDEIGSLRRKIAPSLPSEEKEIRHAVEL